MEKQTKQEPHGILTQKILDLAQIEQSSHKLFGFMSVLIEVDREQKFNNKNNEVQNNRSPDITN